MEPSNARVVIYARYSSDQQRDASIDDQLRICRLRAEREGWEVAEVFADHAISGSTLLRPGYQALLARLRNVGADVVLAESLDRFSRDLEHIAAFYKQVSFARARIVTLAEGEVSDLHIGLKGTMGALYLKDLAAKTHRGLEGRIRAGRSVGKAPYGYRVIRRLAQNGEPDRGQREIDEVQAAVVRRIFADYAAGLSPRAIARALNTEGVPGPTGGIWYDSVIRGHVVRNDGLLRNPIYNGRLVWNRLYNTKNPIDGKRVRRPHSASDLVVPEKPELAIVDEPTWQRVQDRLILEAATAGPPIEGQSKSHFSSHRRPRHLLSGKAFCGICGLRFGSTGKDYLGCRQADQGACSNKIRPRRPRLENQVLEALGRQLMQPQLVAAFIEEFKAAWKETTAGNIGNADQYRREIRVVETRIGHLVDAIADGLRSPDLEKRLGNLDRRRVELVTLLDAPCTVMPTIPADLAAVYHNKVSRLREALSGPDHTEALETARTLVDRIVITPAGDPDGPPDIELIGDLLGMFKAGGLPATHLETNAKGGLVSYLHNGSAKGGLRAAPLP